MLILDSEIIVIDNSPHKEPTSMPVIEKIIMDSLKVKWSIQKACASLQNCRAISYIQSEKV